VDVVPDNVATLDHAFSNRLEAEKFLYTCYSYIPNASRVNSNIGLCGADELWTNRFRENDGLRVAKGEQNINDPLINYWEGRRGANVNLYNGIRDCNIFLERLEDNSSIPDLPPSSRRRWISEVKFLKAYYHFYLFRMYGPVVIADVNIPISATTEETRVKRMPVDSVVNYISNLYDEAAGDVSGLYDEAADNVFDSDLPLTISNVTTEMGRITLPIVLSMKARLWVTAASPLFNGNPDYRYFKDKDGVQLFPTEFDPEKWVKAREACEAALIACEEAGIRPYDYNDTKNLPEETFLDMKIRNSFSDDLWSSETIWGLSGGERRGDADLQQKAMSRLNPNAQTSNTIANDELNPTIQITDLYYTKNGVPVDEDKTWLTGMGRRDIVAVGSEQRYNLSEGYEVSAMHIDREPRFYANLGFDGSIWYMDNSTAATQWTLKCRVGQQQARFGADWYSVTGYWPKKLVNTKYVITDNSQREMRDYPWPEMRLSDLYLLYAETLCETGDLDKAIEYLDKVRARVGLQGVVESWSAHSTKSDKYDNPDGLMEIIKQERAIELMFEGSRYWDLRRWKDLSALNQTIQGWDIDQEAPAFYYRPLTIHNQSVILPRDYFSPIREYALIVNPNLVQNPGW
jgi:hypothetical protein